MKLLYFNVHNGECVPAYTVLPQYRATITGSKIHKIEASFNVGNIIRNGMDWYQTQIKEEYESWTYKHKHLMPSLKRLAIKQSIRHPFKYTNFNDEHVRFPFVIVWKESD